MPGAVGREKGRELLNEYWALFWCDENVLASGYITL